MPAPFEAEFPGGSESANASVVALVQAGEAFLALANRTLRRHGLSAAGAQVLAIVEGAGGDVSPTLIADRLIVTTATVTSLLDTLERHGLLARRPDPVDRRRVLVSLTDEGQAVTNRFLPEIVALQTSIMAAVSEADRRRLSRTLAAVQKGIDDLDAEAVVAAARPRRAPPVGRQ